MTWFERITGFPEADYATTQARLQAQAREGRLWHVDGQRSWGMGRLETPMLHELRERVAGVPGDGAGRLGERRGDVRSLHAEPASHGAVFQVASQFNLLEMVGPDVTPEQGVTRYAHDGTQGPACAMAAGAGTLWRNYLVPVAGSVGQTAARQIDCSADLGAALGNVEGALWRMRNGYLLPSPQGLRAIDDHLTRCSPEEIDALRGLLRVGVHWDVEVTNPGAPAGQTVTQVYCSALPVAYARGAQGPWDRFATLVLEAAYEATLIVGRLNQARGVSPAVFLTRLGGGVFGNRGEWIDGAMTRAVGLPGMAALDLRVVRLG